MPLLRDIPLACPTCGHQGRYPLEPTEDRPLVALVRCEACATPFGVEVRLTVTIETSVCRLALPSTTPVEPAATAAPAQDDVPRPRRVVSPLDRAMEEMPLEPTDVTQDSVVPATPAAAPPRGDPDWSEPEAWRQAFAASPLEGTQESPAPAAPAETVTPPRGEKAARPKAAAKPKRTARTPKGRK